MSERQGQSMIAALRELAGTTPIEVQIRGEQAAGLGALGASMAAALDLLAATADDDPERERRLWAATAKVWHYFIQREACGLRDHRQAIAFYRIPADVLSRLGARPPEGLEPV
jgi:hypothetical protein